MQMNNEILDEKKYNFWILLKDFNIIIPIIQRDYVQGRIDDNVNQIRENLLEDIKNSIPGIDEALAIGLLLQVIDKMNYSICFTFFRNFVFLLEDYYFLSLNYNRKK